MPRYNFPLNFLLLLLGAAAVSQLAGCTGPQPSDPETDARQHIDLGRLYTQQGQFRSAIIELRNALQVHPQSEAARRAMVELLFELGDFGRAEIIAGQLTAAPDATGDDYVLFARALLGQRKVNAAGEALATARRADSPPNEASLEMAQGELSLLTNVPAAANRAFARALELQPGNADALIGQARAAIAANDLEQGLTLAKAATELEPNNADAWNWLGRLHLEARRYNDAEQALSRALVESGQQDLMTSERFQLLSRLAAVLEQLGRIDAALEYRQLLADSQPGKLQQKLADAEQAFNKGNLLAAEKLLQDILSQSPKHRQTGIMLGIVKLRKGEFVRAERLFSEFIDPAVASAEERSLMAMAKQRLNRSDEALNLLAGEDMDDLSAPIKALMGHAAMASGDNTRALQLLLDARRQAPDDVTVLTQLASFHLQQNNPQAALDTLANVPKRSHDGSVLSLEAQALVDLGRPEEALQRARTWLNSSNTGGSDSSNNEASLIVAQLLMDQGGEPEAIRLFKAVLAREPENLTANLGLGALALRRGDLATANTYSQALLAVNPNEPEALKLLVLAGAEDPAGTINRLIDLADKSEDPTAAALLLGRLHLQQGKPAAVLADLERIPQERRQDPGVFQDRRSLLVLIGRGALDQPAWLDAGLAAIKTARAEDPENTTLAYLEARILSANGRQTDALELVQSLLQIAPNYRPAWLLKGDTLAMLDRHEDALVAFREAGKLEQDAIVATRLYLSLDALGRTDEAIGKLADHAENDKSLLDLGRAYQRAGRLQEAQATYLRVLERNPNTAQALNNLAWLMHETGQQGAEDLARRAVKAAPNSPDILDTLGWILLQQGQRTEAREVLEQAAQLAPNNTEIANHLAAAKEG